MSFRIRRALPEDAARIDEIERMADLLLIERFHASHWPTPDEAAQRFAEPGFLLIAETEDTPAGFVHVLELDGHAHLEQVSVLPRFARRGAGRMLVEASKSDAAARGYTTMTLRTYVDVPWNAPFYVTCGFAETSPDTETLRRLVDVEERLGLFDYGPRIQMTAMLMNHSSSG